MLTQRPKCTRNQCFLPCIRRVPRENCFFPPECVVAKNSDVWDIEAPDTRLVTLVGAAGGSRQAGTCWLGVGPAGRAPWSPGAGLRPGEAVASDVRREPLLPAVNSKTSNIRANFENLAKEKEQEDRRKAEAERAQRMARERREQEEARRQLEVSAAGVGDGPSAPGPEGSRRTPCGWDSWMERTPGLRGTPGWQVCAPLASIWSSVGGAVVMRLRTVCFVTCSEVGIIKL